MLKRQIVGVNKENMMEIKLKRLHKDAKVPTYGTERSAYLDLYAVEDVMLSPGETKVIRSGWAFEIPELHYVDVLPRSGLACKKGIISLNSVGIIDSDYRGEILTTMRNLGEDPVLIAKGDRYAQMAIKRSIYTTFREVDELTPTERGSGGFGSTGK
jgi:dUTP pyrophosphatase